MHLFHLSIDGRAVAGASTFEVINPATETVVAQCPRADRALLDSAVSAAKAAFAGWANTSIDERRDALLKVADDIAARTEELAALLTSEQGKPLVHATAEIAGSADVIRVLASFDIVEKIVHANDDGRFVEQRGPLGVVAAITPWNFPISLLMVKVVPALLAGNCVVAKPAATTPLTTLSIGEIFASHVPPGVYNTIADLNDLGDALTGHPDIAKVSFTGSTATGAKVMASAAPLLKRITLELGGNDAAIVLDDVDARDVARSLFEGAMLNSGQVCVAIKRAYVPSTLYDAVCAELESLAIGAVIDDGAQPGTQYGPLQNRQQYERVQALIADSARHGTILGGGTIDGPGFFIRPTIVRDIGDDSRIVREEQFGPVLPVLRYDDIDDAIARANDTEMGLAGTVWARDLERAFAVASRLDTGMVWINSHMNVDPLVSMGGAKQSGIGRELGQEGLEEFTQRRLVYIPV